MTRALVVVLLVALVGTAHAGTDDAHALEERLIAPCCWRGSLRDHRSPLADALRTEIETRIDAGERPDAVEASLVSRYGTRMRGLPRDWDPRRGAAILTAVASLLALALLARWLRRRPPRPAPPTPTAPLDRARLDDVLDDELAALDR